MKNPYYAGVGSRETPAHVLNVMARIGQRLAEQGMILRSGNAKGADKAWASRVHNPGQLQIFLPTPGFGGGYHNPAAGFYEYQRLPAAAQARTTVARFHPRGNSLGEWATHAMARNAMQVLGPDLTTPSAYLLAYAPIRDGLPQGGTAQAIRIAQAHNIPVRNLAIPEHLERAMRFLEG